MNETEFKHLIDSCKRKSFEEISRLIQSGNFTPDQHAQLRHVLLNKIEDDTLDD